MTAPADIRWSPSGDLEMFDGRQWNAIRRLPPGAAMSRRRLRPPHSPERLAQIYAAPHDHRRWRDHELRVTATIEMARWIPGDVHSAADLSCGNGAVLEALPVTVKYFGDFAPGYELTGPIEQTILEIPVVDLFVCCETLEHLDDPDGTLKRIRQRAKNLILSTPVEAWDDGNEEHYWAWSRAAVEEMLAAAEFHVGSYMELDLRPMGPQFYCFGIWAAW